jgi:hypothetical protein
MPPLTFERDGPPTPRPPDGYRCAAAGCFFGGFGSSGFVIRVAL